MSRYVLDRRGHSPSPKTFRVDPMFTIRRDGDDLFKARLVLANVTFRVPLLITQYRCVNFSSRQISDSNVDP